MIDNENKGILDSQSYARFHTGRTVIMGQENWGVFIHISNGRDSAVGAFSVEEAETVIGFLQEIVAEAKSSEPPFTGQELVEEEVDYTAFDDVE
jgi:hypothetical protein